MGFVRLAGARSLTIPDAAHRKAVCAPIAVQRAHERRVVVQVARIGIACSVGRRRPGPAAPADTRQGSRRTLAVARSRGIGAIAGMDGREVI